MSNANLADPVRAARVMAVRILLAACLLIPGAARAGAESPSAGGPGGVQDRQQPAPAYLVIENVGQYAAEARFLLKQGERHIWLTDDALWLTLPDPVATGLDAGAGPRHKPGHRQQPDTAARSGAAIRFTFQGANPAATLEPYGRLPAHVSYLIGSDPARWQRDVPVWSGARYRDLYPGVDLVIGDTTAGAMPRRLEARPGADLGAVTLAAEGADSITPVAGGLRLETKGRAINLALPAWSLAGQSDLVKSTAVQESGQGRFAITPGSALQLGAATAASGLESVTAGDLIYNTPLGGMGTDTGYGIAVDYLGNAYITGQTRSDDFPVTTGSYDTTNNGGDELTEAFVVKLNAAGSTDYVTYLGGAGPDTGWGIAVDGGLATVVGETNSTDFPGAPKATLDGSDIFVAALNATGTGVRYVTRLGGAGEDIGYGIAVDGTNVYVTGSSSSTSLPLAATCGSGTDTNLVVARLSASGAPVYTTCLGNTADEVGSGIAVRSGTAYVTGQSYSGSGGDILVARFNTNGTLAADALIGGANAADWGNGIAVDGSGNVFVAATTSPPDTNPSDFRVTTGTPAYGGGSSDAVIMKLTPTLGIDFATFLGGNDEDYAYAIAMDTVQGLYVAGGTKSTNFPVTTGAIHGVQFDAFVARLHLSSGAPNKVTYATFLGDANDDWALGIATDTGGHAFVAGSTAASWDSTIIDALMAKLKVSSPPDAPAITITRSGTSAKLEWPNTAPRYQVFQSSRPYFIPGDWSSLAPVADDAAIFYLDTDALNLVDARFYVVKAVDATPAASANSKRAGKFTYPLTSGGN